MNDEISRKGLDVSEIGKQRSPLVGWQKLEGLPPGLNLTEGNEKPLTAEQLLDQLRGLDFGNQAEVVRVMDLLLQIIAGHHE